MNRLFRVVVCLLFVLGVTQSVFASDSDESNRSGKFIKIGAGLMVGGGVLATVGGANVWDDGGGPAFLSGIAIFGAGTGMLIWGLSHRSDSSKFRDSLESAQSRSFIVGVSLLRNGGAAGAVLRW